MRRDVHKQAEDATKLGEMIGLTITMALMIMSLLYLSLRGDDIRAARMGVTVHEIDRMGWAEVEHRIEAERAKQTNECGHACIARIKSEGELE